MSPATPRGVHKKIPVLVAFVALSLACEGSPSGPTSIAPGMWGGEHVTMSVSAAGSHLEFDCAHGDIQGPLEAPHGQLAVNGTFIREHGGPIRVDEVADSHPAIYSGAISKDTMQLTVRLTDSGDVIGPFSLVRGMAGRVVKCL